MKLVHLYAMMALAASSVFARPGATCDSITTIYVTTTPAMRIQTLIFTEMVRDLAEPLSNTVPSEEFGPESARVDPAVQSTTEVTTHITMTSTSFFTVTKFSTLENPTSIPTVTEGPYYFLLHDGTTQFLDGKKPPSTGRFVTSTHTISVVPLPVGSAVSEELEGTSTSTSYSTHVMTVIMSEHGDAKSIIDLLSSASAATNSFTGYGSSGWNTSSPAFIEIESAPSGFSSTQLPSIGTATKTTSTPVPQHATSTALGAVSNVIGAGKDSEIAVRAIDIMSAPTASGWTQVPPNNGGPKSWHTPVPQHMRSLDMGVMRSIPQPMGDLRIEERQVGSVVVVTMDGAVVSWTNSYSGDSYITSAQSSASHSPLVAAVTTPSAETPISPIVPVSTVISSPVPTSSPTTASQVPTTFSPFSVTSSSTVTIIQSLVSVNSSTTATSAPVPPICTIDSHFTINFDDLPHFSAPPNATDYPPIFNPYRGLYWSAGFSYAPPPTDPFIPASGRQLGVYVVARGNVISDNDPGVELDGEFGAGPRASENEYWINAYSMYLGCDHAGPGDCVIAITGYSGISGGTVNRIVTQQACQGNNACRLSQVMLPNSFRNLNGIQIIATVNGEQVNWYMDNIEGSWSNDTCAAASFRASQR